MIFININFLQGDIKYILEHVCESLAGIKLAC